MKKTLLSLVTFYFFTALYGPIDIGEEITTVLPREDTASSAAAAQPCVDISDEISNTSLSSAIDFEGIELISTYQ